VNHEGSIARLLWDKATSANTSKEIEQISADNQANLGG